VSRNLFPIPASLYSPGAVAVPLNYLHVQHIAHIAGVASRLRAAPATLELLKAAPGSSAAPAENEPMKKLGLRPRCRWLRHALAPGVGTLVLGLLVAPVSAQSGEPVARTAGTSVQKQKKKSKAARKQAQLESGWRGTWNVALSSTYDDNVFRLTPAQQQALGANHERYADMNVAYDLANSLRLRTRVRGPGLGSRRLDLGGDARLDLYTLSPRQSSVRLGLSARQSISRRHGLHAELSFVPAEFRRNYVSGADAMGGAAYAPGIRQTLRGGIGYERTLLSGRRGPQLDASLTAVGARRSYADFPWRDRQELGAEVSSGVRLGVLNVNLSAGHLRAFHARVAEPVRIDESVTLMELERDFDVTDVAAGASVRLTRGVRAGLSFEQRARTYLATLAVDPVYGDRQDRRNTYGAELRLRAAPRVEVRLGGDVQRQSTFRPGRGDTGDEARYSRRTASLRVEYAR
jgi:hypothetical protein